MTLTDVYCRVNRARGLELMSPEDLVNACQMLEPMQLPVRMQVCAMQRFVSIPLMNISIFLVRKYNELL